MRRIALSDCFLRMLWPAFLLACLLEALVFVVVDPLSIDWFENQAEPWRRDAIYTISFFAFWGCASLWAALTRYFDSMTD